MFGRSRPIVFNRYERRRNGRRVPRWLLLLLLGLAGGAAAVLAVQERVLPPRLSAAESAALRQAYDAADAERRRLRADLSAQSRRLAQAQADNQRLTDEAGRHSADTATLRDDLAAAVTALPADPRGGSVEIRAGRFAVAAGALEYDVVLSRDAAKVPAAVMQLVLTGDGPGTARVVLPPLALQTQRHQVLRGSAALPAGFRPQQASVQVLDRPGGRLLGSRVLLVRPGG